MPGIRGEKRWQIAQIIQMYQKSPFTYFPARYMGSINAVNPFFLFFFPNEYIKSPQAGKIEPVKNSTEKNVEYTKYIWEIITKTPE